MMNVVAVGSKIVEMFQIKEYTAEAFEKGMTEAGWKYDDNGTDMILETVRTFENGYELKEVEKRVALYNVCIETEMKYSEYKTNYSGCRTKKDSYDKTNKTIVVYVPQWS